jgi:hypothetical protein
MPFTVVREGGMNLDEYEAYMRLVHRRGIDVARTLRTPEPGTRGRWLPVWAERADAEQFARELSAPRKAPRWQVHAVKEEEVSEGALGPVDVSITCRRYSCTYGLHPFSRVLIHKKFPSARLLESVHVEAAVPPGEECQQFLWDQVARMLTGLTEEQLGEVGGYRVYEPKGHKLLRQPILTVEEPAR